MKRFRNILYILDTDPVQETQVSALVQNLARQNKGSVRIIRVLEDTIIDSVGRQFSSRIQKLVEMEQKHAGQELEQVLAQPGWEGIATSGEILIGKDFITVIRKVLEEEHDLVVKARRNSEATDQFAMRLFRKCPCPVWIIATSAARPGKTIIGAVDLAGIDKESRQLNRKIVELTHSLAQMHQGEAHFVHAWHLEYETTMRSPRFQVDDQEIDAMKREIVTTREAAFSQLFADAGLTVNGNHIHLIEGPPATVIKQQLESLQGDILIMGTVGRTGLPGLLLGNKAEEVLSQVNCTVLAVKPNGFISPVTL